MDKKLITGIVLSGGRSSRMGQDKSLMILNGKPLIQYAIDTIKPLCDKVVISSNFNNYDFTGCEVWPDEMDVQAPITGIYSCIKQSPTEVNLVISCDMPLIQTMLFEYLLTFANNHDIIVPTHNKYFEPLCAIYKKSVLPAMEISINKHDYKLMTFIKSTSYLPIEITEDLTVYTSAMFLNVNTPEEYNHLVKYF